MLIDSTLREGAQMYGVYFSDALRRRILASLLRAGVDEVEVGWAGQEGLRDLLVRAGRLGDDLLSEKIIVWSPMRSMDLIRTAETGARRVHVGVPVSDAHIVKRLRTDREGLLKKLRLILEQANALGFSYVSVGLEDISRADWSFALKVARIARKYGARRVRLSDTVGLLAPLETERLVRFFVREAGLAVGFHGHNDYGMATANAVTALASGADCVDVSALGIGERAGIASLEEVSARLNSKGSKRIYDQREIVNMARMVADAARIPVSRNKALLGEDIFACESGLHLHGMAADTTLFEPFPPETVSAQRKLALGMKSGKSAVAGAAGRSGICLSAENIKRLTKQVRNLSKDLARPLRDKEFQTLAAAVLNSS